MKVRILKTLQQLLKQVQKNLFLFMEVMQ